MTFAAFAAAFMNPGLLAGLGLIAVPIIIHLLYRFRFRRVRWAAMDFLLESQQRNQRRIFLEQLLLLLLRCLVVAALVMLVARPILQENFAALLATGQRVEHLLLLDDSYSMAQQQGSQTAFESGRDTCRQLLDQLAQFTTDHRVTLVRFSRLQQPDLRSQRWDRQQQVEFVNTLDRWPVTNLAITPKQALQQAVELLDQTDASSRILHILSDFRRADWYNDAELIEQLQQLSDEGIKIQLIDAAVPVGENLGVEQLTAKLGTAAAEVPLTVSAVVRNFGDQAAERVNLLPRADGRPLPARTIERIEAGQTATVQFDVQFNSTGIHQVSVELPADPLPADNRRYLAVPIQSQIPILIVDGTKRREGRYLELALNPGLSTQTGLDPEIRTPEGLLRGDIDQCRTIFLLGVSELTTQQLEVIETFVANGGGLAIFLGNEIQPTFYNDSFYRTGQGLFPVPLSQLQEPQLDATVTEPDFQFEPHPIFRVFSGERNTFLQTVRVLRFFGSEPPATNPNNTNQTSSTNTSPATSAPTTAPNDKATPTQATAATDGLTTKQRGPVKTILKFRDGSPLAYEMEFGKGRVITFLTSAGPSWNTWARNPSYLVAMLELNSYLAEPPTGAPDFAVGTPWSIRFAAANFRRQVELIRPIAETDLLKVPPGEELSAQLDLPLDTLEAEAKGLLFELDYNNTQEPGVYRLRRRTAEGQVDVIGRNYNLEPREGNLLKINESELNEQLQGVNYTYQSAANYQVEREESNLEPRDWILLLLLLLLIGEQLLAYRLSFHIR